MKIEFKTNYMALITLVLVVARLTDTITWPWIWVFAPLWMPFAFIGTILAGIVAVSAISFVLNLVGKR